MSTRTELNNIKWNVSETLRLLSDLASDFTELDEKVRELKKRVEQLEKIFEPFSVQTDHYAVLVKGETPK